MPSTHRRSCASETQCVVAGCLHLDLESRARCDWIHPTVLLQQAETDDRGLVQAVGGDFDAVTDARRAGEADGARLSSPSADDNSTFVICSLASRVGRLVGRALRDTGSFNAFQTAESRVSVDDLAQHLGACEGSRPPTRIEKDGYRLEKSGRLWRFGVRSTTGVRAGGDPRGQIKAESQR